MGKSEWLIQMRVASMTEKLPMVKCDMQQKKLFNRIYAAKWYSTNNGPHPKDCSSIRRFWPLSRKHS